MKTNPALIYTDTTDTDTDTNARMYYHIKMQITSMVWTCFCCVYAHSLGNLNERIWPTTRCTH